MVLQFVIAKMARRRRFIDASRTSIKATNYRVIEWPSITVMISYRAAQKTCTMLGIIATSPLPAVTYGFVLASTPPPYRLSTINKAKSFLI